MNTNLTVKFNTTMTPSDDKSMTLDKIFSDDVVDYDSDNVLPEEEENKPFAPSLVLRRERPHAPNSFPKRAMVLSLNANLTSQSVEPGVIINRLDKEQDQIVTESNNRRRALALAFKPSSRDCGFHPPSIDERLPQFADQSLASIIIISEATTLQACARRELLQN